MTAEGGMIIMDTLSNNTLNTIEDINLYEVIHETHYLSLTQCQHGVTGSIDCSMQHSHCF